MHWGRRKTLKRLFFFAGLTMASFPASANAADWQWSVPFETGRAFLWVPPACHSVRALVLAQNNMIEQGILQHAGFRDVLTKLCMAEIFIAPPYETWQNAQTNAAANRTLDGLLQALADRSGYSELATVPIAPMGHSALASFPWNFAAWNPQRTLAILSIQGDAPQTDVTGNGRPNAAWGDRVIDGIPGVMVMGEYEWLESRLAPALAFRVAHPNAPIAVLAEPGSGHFNYPDHLVEFLALFLRKAVAWRLPLAKGEPLRPVDPWQGWLVQRWFLDKPRTVRAAPNACYDGDKAQAFWAFDEETARAIESFGADQVGKKPQLLAFVDRGNIQPQTETHQQIELAFHPLDDGLSFKLSAAFLDKVPAVAKNLSRWTGLPAGSAIGHAGEAPLLSRVSGPVVQLAPDTFRVELDRIASTGDRRALDIWLLASQQGDVNYKSAVQQGLLRLPVFASGGVQSITFPPIANRSAGLQAVVLHASSNNGRPVHYYVLEGPAEVEGEKLRFTAIPARTKYPIRVTVVAWLLGREAAPALRSATPVSRTFYLTAPLRWKKPQKSK